MTAGKCIKNIRDRLNLSQREFASELKISQTAVSQYELNQKEPSLTVMNKIIKYAKSKRIKIKLEDIFPDD